MSTLKVTNIAGLTGSSTNVIDGLAKAWVHYNGNGTAAISNSFNTTSITDNGSGDFTIAYSSSLNDANYSATSSSRNSVNDDVYVCAIKLHSTSSTRTVHNNSSGGVLYASSRLDHTHIGLTIHGDLA